MRLCIREKLLLLIMVPLCVLLLTVGAVERLSENTREAAAASLRSNQALQAAQSLLVTLVDAETGMRGYVLTGNRRFTEPYRAASYAFKKRIAVLEGASTNAEKKQNGAVTVVALAHDSFRSVDRYVRLTDQGRRLRARTEIASGAGKRKMDRFRKAVASYERTETSRQAATAVMVARMWSAMRTLLVLGTFLALAVSTALYLTITRSMIVRLRGLEKTANAVAAGAIPQVRISGNDAITDVQRSFQQMAVLLRAREEALAQANALQRAILAASDRALITTGRDGIITSFNAEAERIFGIAAKDALGRSTPHTFHLLEKSTWQAASAPDKTASDAGQQRAEEQHEWTFVRADGSQVVIASRLTPLRDDGDSIFGFVHVSEEITERKIAERAILQSESEQRDYARQLRALHLIANNVGTSQTNQMDRSLKLGLEQLKLDAAFVGFLDETGAQIVIENSVSAVDCVEGYVTVGTSMAVNAAFVGQPTRSTAVYAVESLAALRETSPDVPALGAGAYIVAPIFVAGALYGAIGFVGNRSRAGPLAPPTSDFVRIVADLVGVVIEREKERVRLDGLAFFDALTGLPNRVLVLDRLTQTVLSAKRYQETFALLYLDLDGFKAVNDTYGHAVGDEVLKVASRRFERLMRTSDTVARLGGDEFVILAPKLASPFDAGDLASRVVKSMHRPIVVNGVEHPLSISVGISVFPHDGLEAGTLIDSADRALYAAKAKGKDTYVFASDFALPKAREPERLRVVEKAM